MSWEARPAKPLKAYVNVLKMRVNMFFRRPVVSSYPMMAMIEPSLACNLRCPACPTGLQLGLRPKASITADLFRSTIEAIGDYVFDLSMYNWGEPLLHKQTPELIALAKERGVRVKLSSNLSLKLTDDYVERLVLSGLDEILVGLDGTTPEVYERYRKRGDLQLVRDNLTKIQETKARLGRTTPHLVWQFLVFRHNEHQIEEARAVHREWGADSFIVGGAEMPADEYADGIEPSTLPEYNRYHPQHPVQVRDRMIRHDDKACTWLYGIFVMNPNGQVSPCCATADEKEDFAVYQPEGGFFAAWNSGRFRAARALFRKGGMKDRAAAGPVPGEDDLICHRCPIVFLQDRVHIMIAQLALDLQREAFRTFSPRALLAFLLMGGPSFYAVRLFVRKLLRGEDVWSHV